MNPPIKVLLITVYPLWAEACREVLERRPRRIDVTVSIADYDLSNNLPTALAICPDVALVSLDLPAEGLNMVRTLHAAGYTGSVMVVCSHYTLPSLEELAEVQVQSIISSLASLDDLASSIYALADGHPDPLLQQHLRANRALSRKPLTRIVLNERDRAMLQLVAHDLTDQEIADQLHLSVRTVSNQRIIFTLR